MLKYQTILLDLDGTLTDPKLGITKSVQYALRNFDIHVENLDELVPFIGPPLANSFIEVYHFDADQAKQAVDYYREYFKDTGIYENDVYPGIRDLLTMLREQGRRLIVATSKPTVFAKRVIAHFELDKYFDDVCGSNLDGTMSDKAEIIQSILDRYQVEKDQVIMIGDRKHDIIGAHKNDIASIGVEYGYGSNEEIAQVEPTFITKTVHDLIQLFSHE
ncbi:HAD family hydrolase [Paenibacillus terrigena]|uniref:HAD family hydrolase n=1 Tax=Paenibacillus terrigena TaxID=369333 RepID=UPI0028D859D2|nr:HAD family hydrolase [Paenibacillus terrigena]